MGVAERKEREKERRKQDIVDAAEKVFFSLGFEQATMISIAEEAELSKGTLYLYFENKNELCMAIILRALRSFRKDLEDNLNKDDNGLDQLMSISNQFFNFIKTYPDYYRALSNFKVHEAGVNSGSEISLLRKKENQRINDFVKSAIEKGQKDGSINSKVDSKLLAYSIWGEQNGLLPNYLDYTTDNEKMHQKQIDAMKYMLKLIINEVSLETGKENV